MDKIAELRAKRAESANAFAALVDKMSEAEYVEQDTDESTLDELKIEIAAIDAKILRVQEANAFKASLAKPVDAIVKDTATVKRANRFGPLKAFKGNEDAAYKSGMFFAANFAKSDQVRADATRWCNDNGVATVQKYQAEGINTSSGFLVPTEFETAVIDLREMYGTFRQEARIVPMSSDAMTIPRRASGVTAYYVGENASITESQKGWDQVTLSAKKLACLTRMSTELAEDAVISIADDLANEMAYAFAVAEDAAGWTGDGTSTSGGIYGFKKKFVDGLSSYIGAVDLATGHDTIAEVDKDDVAKVMAALPKYAEPNAKFFMSMQVWAGAFQRLLSGLGGNAIGDLTNGGKPTRSYLGYPVVIDQTLPTTFGDLSDVPIFYFGDLTLACRMGTRRGITVKVSEDRYMEFDQIAIQATERFDIVVHDIGDATNAGPVVAAMGE